MASAAEILQFEHADLLISKQKLERARGIEVVRIKREQRAQELCFSSRPFVLCGLPVRRLPKEQLVYERRNGRFLLQITGHPEFGVPFGQDRLVPIFLATLAVQQKSQTIRFRTAAEMLESFGMHTGGKEYRRLVGAFERIFGATIFFGTDTTSGRATMVQRCRWPVRWLGKSGGRQLKLQRNNRKSYARCPARDLGMERGRDYGFGR
jgi:hypothetical protein